MTVAPSKDLQAGQQDAPVRCSEWARANRLSPVGTVGTYRGYALLELPLPWPRDIGQTEDGAALAPVLAAHGYRLQAVVPDGASSAPRRMTLYVTPPGQSGFAGYRRLEATVDDSVTETLARLIRAGQRTRPSEFDSPGTDVLVCTHGTRDSCCGRFGANLAVALRERPWRADVRIRRTSHTGGHRFAPTFLVLPEGTSWGFADADIVEAVLNRSGDAAAVSGNYRGCTGLGSSAEQALEAAVFARVGWSLLDRRRTGSVDGPHVRLSWNEAGAPVVWTGEVEAGRRVPMPECHQPVSTATKHETELAVRSVRRLEPHG
jgi:hypothetical protein